MNAKLICYQVLIASILIFGCSKSSNPSSDEIVVYQEGNVIIILENINDSRCPINVTCVWEGNAEVSLRMDMDDVSDEFALNTYGFDPYFSSQTVMGLNVELIELTPYPMEGATYALSDYTVTLQVTE